MLKIFLVDDEYLVLKGIEAMLKNQKEIDVEIRTATDAVEAMQKLTAWNPDIIITDINMPEMNGLSMLEQVNRSHPSCKFMIISGYEKTEYLKHALQLHVVDYLTKPIDKRYLISQLKSLDERKEQEILHTLLKIKISVFTDEPTPGYSFSREEVLRIFPEKDMTLCTISLPNMDDQTVLRYIRDYFRYSQIISQNGRYIFLLNYSVAISCDQIRSLMESLFSRIPCGIAFMTRQSSVHKALSEISFYFQKALCDFILSLLPVSSERREIITEQISLRTLRPAIQVLTQGYDVSSYLKKACAPSSDSEDHFLLVFTEFLSAYLLTTNSNIPADAILQLYQHEAAKPHDRRALATFVEKHLTFHSEIFSLRGDQNYSLKIADACQFIEEHYKEDIALTQVAEHLCVNYSYLSYVFRKETGVTFLQYLTNVRMREACRLMTENPDMPLEEVAAFTGYHSVSYFHKIFKARFGVSPRQWLQQ